jgi:TonB family protein
MTGAWKEWEGQVVDGEFPLRQYLGGSEHSAVFLTERAEREPQKAAIKLIPADPENAELQLSRWRQATKLTHPHLIRLFQMGRCQLSNLEMLYVVIEYAEEDLSQILPHRPLTPAEARDLLEPALDALAYIHGQGFVHAHIKPANIMALDDRVKISSDGLCRMDEPSGGPETPGTYDPPETAEGAISPAGDVWSLGITLVEALTQRLPVWEGTERGDPVVPETMPAPFFDIARNCLRRDPQLRWTVADISARLRQPSPVRQEQAPARPQAKFANWRYVVSTAAVVLALAAILGGFRLLNRRQQAQPTPSIASEQSRVQPKLKKRPVKPETGESAQRTSDKKEGSSGTAPLAASLRPGAGAKTSTGGPVQGEPSEQVLPDVSQKARDTIRGTVRVSVRVRVDPSGSVQEAKFDSPGPSRYFADLALEAARRWSFWPPKVNGRNVPSEWILRFEFERTGTKVFPVQDVP